MRFRHTDGSTIHLAYCTNVHAAEDLTGVLSQLETFAEPVRELLGVDRLGLGLWLARDVASELASDDASVARLRAELALRGLEVVTLNGFPYRGFHAPVVKHAVYHPDWAEQERLRYTADLARILVRLLPDDVDRGSISTLPLAWREPWPADRRDAARRQLDDLAAELAKTAAVEGRIVRVGFEPEPGCVVETTGEAVAHLSDVDTDWLGVCLDICHLAVAFEDPEEALNRLAAARLPVVKTQVSCALQADDAADPSTREALGSFVEPRFLHQTRQARSRRLHGTDDLGEALSGAGGLTGEEPWRVHFHVPLHDDAVPPLSTTRPVVVDALRALVGGPESLTDHLEVETYTWQVLPEAQRPRDVRGLVEGLAAELEWTRRELLALGLEEITR
jgi:sugar phosphate isomerase/epimerase